MEAPQTQGIDVEPKRSKATSWVLGCLVGLVLFAGLCAGGSWLMCGSMINWAVEAMHDVFVQAVEESDLSDEDIDSIKVDLGRLKDAFLEERVRQDQLQDFEEDFERILGLGIAKFMDSTVLPEAGMDAEELEDARRAAQRFARGIKEGSIDVERDLEGIDIEQDDSGDWDVEKVREAVATMRELADQRNIPDEPYDIDVAGEFRQLVDSLIDD